MNEQFTLKILPLIRALRLYHRHEVQGLQNIPTKGAAIIACTHSLATYDMLLLMAAAYDRSGSLPRALIDRLFYKLPGIGNLMEQLGCVIGDLDHAQSILANGEVLYVAPGGMEESLRSSNQKYQICWNQRRGFAKLSILSGAPIILAACPFADDIFDVSDSAITRWAYRQFRVPVFFARGIGRTFLPKPQRLIHYVSEPIYPPKISCHLDPKTLEDYHSHLVSQMKLLIDRVLNGKNQTIAERSVRKAPTIPTNDPVE